MRIRQATPAIRTAFVINGLAFYQSVESNARNTLKFRIAVEKLPQGCHKTKAALDRLPLSD
jgi:hypothetical protein